MSRRSEYVVYLCGDNEWDDEILDGADVDGGYTKRQVDKMIKEALEGSSTRSRPVGYYLGAVWHYTQWGDNQKLYWIHPLLE